jgi:hypothetical protein
MSEIAEKYDIDIPTTIRKNYELMPKNWTRYLEQLREVDDNLYNQKEQFKMGLLSSAPSSKRETQADDMEKTDEEVSSASEM